MIVTIHQPEHLPWLGFFDKASQADVLVLLDDVQFRKNYFQNRNRILSANGPVWLTVPVFSKGKGDQLINEVRINNDGNPLWGEKCWKSMSQCLGKASFFPDHREFFNSLYQTRWELLGDLNATKIRYLVSALGIDAELVSASELAVTGERSERLVNICAKLGATTYLSGVSGKEYLDLAMFGRKGIEVRFQEFYHPIYKQLYNPFVACLSVVDLLFNYGPDSLNVIGGIGVEKMNQVFL